MSTQIFIEFKGFLFGNFQKYQFLSFVFFSLLLVQGSNLSAQCQNDTEAPVFTNCPDDFIVPYDKASCDATATWNDIVLTDNCDLDPTVTSSTHQSGDKFTDVSTTVVLKSKDIAGNEAQCTFVVTLKGDTGMNVTCPGNIKVFANSGCFAKPEWAIPIVSDPCNTNPLIESNYSSGDEFNAVYDLGGVVPTIVKYTVSNTFLDTAKCEFEVIVEDITPPVILGCDLDTTLYTKGTGCSVAYAFDEPQPKDNCDVILLPLTGTSKTYVQDGFPKGTSTITFEAQDGAGNMGSCTFEVIVLDTIPPGIVSCPSDKIYVVAGCDTLVKWEQPEFLDGCDGNDLTITQSLISGETRPTGVYNVVYTAVDKSNNQSFCKFDVTVKDDDMPTMTPCPNDTTLYVGESCTVAYNYKMPTAMDGCDGAIIPVADPAINVFSPIVNTIKITASDKGGNSVSCTFAVIAKDTIPPTTMCPADVVVNTSGVILNDESNIIDHVVASGCEKPIVYFEFPEIIDNCVGMLTDSMVLVDSFAIGTSNMTYNFKDASNNVAACFFTVTVVGDHQAIGIEASSNPVCPNGPVQLASSVTDLGAVFNWTGPGGFTSNEPTPTIDNFNAANEGKYFVRVSIGGCTYEPTDSLQLDMAKNILAVDDDYLVPINAVDELLDVTKNDLLLNQKTSLTITQDPFGGTAFVQDTNIIYSPSTGYVGSDQIAYKVCLKDCPTICGEAIVTIGVDFGSACIIPNVLTPNHDGVNDQLILSCLLAENNSKLLIYNKWGGLVFKQSPYLNEWQGDYNGDTGRPLPDGTYYYIFWEQIDGEAKKGFITIYR